MADKSVKLTIYADSSQLKKALGETDDAADKSGDKLGGLADIFDSKFAAIGLAATAGAVVVVGALAKMATEGAAWLLQLGEDFDAANDKIRVSVGNNPLLNASLDQSLTNIYRGVPSSFDDVSTAVSLLHQRLGATGQPLEDLATQILNLSRITGGDMATNLDEITGLLNNWNISTEAAPGAIDQLFRAFQASGVPVASLAGDLSDAGVELRAFGFTLPESTALIAELGKNGIDVADVMPAMSRAMANAARQGKPLAAAFDETVASIKNAPDDITAMQRGIELFGTRAGPRLAAMIREGKVNVDELFGAISAGSDTVATATADTDDWKEAWERFWHGIEIAAKPAADWVFQTVTDITKAFTGEDGGEGGLGAAWDKVLEKWGDLKKRLEDWWNSTVVPWWNDIAKPWIDNTLIPALQGYGQSMANAFFGWLPGAITDFVATAGRRSPEIFAAGAVLGGAFAKGVGEGLRDAIPGFDNPAVRAGLSLVPVIGPFLNAFGNARATGGLLPDGLTLVGERGPELVDKRAGVVQVQPSETSRGMTAQKIGGDVYLDGSLVGRWVEREVRNLARAGA